MIMSNSNWLQLSSKTAIITGAGSGIGSAIARAFAAQGCNTLLVDVHEENLHTSHHQCQNIITKQQPIKPNSQKPWTYKFTCNVTDESQVKEMIKFADLKIEEHQMIESSCNESLHSQYASILVNAAGITRDGLIQNITEADYDNVLDVNLKGTFLACQAFCASKRLDGLLGFDEKKRHNSSSKTCSGSIINIGSVVSQMGNVGQSNYGASKGGVVGLTKALAKEMAFYSTSLHKKHSDSNDEDHNESFLHKSNIRVNAILPGFIHSPMTEAVPVHIKERVREKISLKEFGEADDVANMALFLASSRSSYVTGTAIECSGMIAL